MVSKRGHGEAWKKRMNIVQHLGKNLIYCALGVRSGVLEGNAFGGTLISGGRLLSIGDDRNQGGVIKLERYKKILLHQ